MRFHLEGVLMLNLEIIQTENGFIVLEGFYRHGNPLEGKKWVAPSADALAELIRDLAKKAALLKSVSQKRESVAGESHVIGSNGAHSSGGGTP